MAAKLNQVHLHAVVVNDDPTQLKTLEELVRKAGLTPRSFTGAEAALDYLLINPGIALIVTDLYMPGIDGWRFCRLLRSPEHEQLNQIPILVVSATFSGEEPERIAADLGVEGFLPSPVDPQRFFESVYSILHRGKTRNYLHALIIEDTESQALSLKQALESNGYHVDIASTAHEAEAAYTQQMYDVVAIDHHLPDGSGDLILVQLHAQQPNCVCLMMTSDPNPQLALNWMKLGASAYLRKPFEPNFLLELCTRLRRERALLRVEDILEERTMELRDSETLYRSLVEHLPQCILRKDLDGRFTFVDSSFCEWMNLPPERILGKTDYDLFQKELAEKYRADDHYVIENKTTFKCVEENFTNRGELRYVEVTKSPLYNQAREIIGVQSIFDDITKQKFLEKSYQEQLSINETLIDAIPDLIFYKDINGVYLVSVAESLFFLE